MLKKIFNRFNIYKELPRSMFTMFLVQVVNRFGDFVAPFLTMFLTIKLGLSFTTTGAVVSASIIIATLGALIGSKLADQAGRKKTYILAQTVSAAALLPCAFLKSPAIIVVLLLTSTFFNGGVRPVIGAIITDLLPPEKRQLGFSLSYLGINIGVAVGPIVAGFLFKNLLPMLFLGDALTSFIAVGLVIKNIKETNPTIVKNGQAHEKHEDGNIFHVLLRRPEVIVFLLIYIIYSAVYQQYKFSLPLTMDKVFLSNGSVYYGWLMSVNALTVVLLSVLIVKYTKRNHSLVNIVLAGLMFAVGFGMLGIVKSFPLYVVSTILWTIGEILVVSNFNVYIANNSPSNFRARLNAISSLSWAAGGVAGTSLVGKYISRSGVSVIWPLTFIFSLIGAAMMLMLYLRNKEVRKKVSSISE